MVEERSIISCYLLCINLLGGLFPLTHHLKKKEYLIQVRSGSGCDFSLFSAIALLAGGVFAWKTGAFLNKISEGNANIFKSLVKNLPGVEKKLQGEDEGKINILLLGMRGEGMDGGALLADTIMVLSSSSEAKRSGSNTIVPRIYPA